MNRRMPMLLTTSAKRKLVDKLLLGMIIPLLAVAGTSYAPTVAAQGQTYELNIPAQDLASALNDLCSASRTQISASSRTLDGKTSSSVAGNHTVEEALSAMLAGTGLVASRIGENSYTLALPASSSTTPERAVEELVVIGTALNVSVGPWEGRSVQDTPYSIAVISSDLIENMQAMDHDQVFRVTPTTQLTRSQLENDQTGVTLRGFTTYGFYRDGMRGDQYGHGTTTEDTARLEVLTGLSGFMYGPGNIGGVINYVTKRPTAERLNRITIGNNGGSNYYLQGDFGGPIDADGTFGYRVNIVEQDGEVAIEGQEIEKQFISAAFDWRVTDELLLRLNASDRDYSPQGGANWGFADGVDRPSASDFDTAYSYGQPWIERTYESSTSGLHTRWEAAENISFRGSLAWSNSVRSVPFANNTLNPDGTYDQTVFAIFAPGVNNTLSEQTDRRAQAYVHLDFSTGNVTHKLTAGGLFSNNIQERYDGDYAENIVYEDIRLDQHAYMDKPSRVLPVDRGNKYIRSDSSTMTWMIGDDIIFNEQWSLLAGMALAEIETKPVSGRTPYSESATTPTLSLVYKPVPWVTGYASYIEALEQGGIAGEEFNGFPVVNAGEVFKPYKSEQIELGIKATVENILLSAALFEIDKGLQYYDITDPSLPRYVQDGRQVHRGLEFSAVGDVSEQLTLIGGLTVLDPTVVEQKQTPELEGNRPVNVSKQFAKLRAEYSFAGVSGLSVVGGLQYYSDRFADAENTDALGSYSLVDIGARYETEFVNVPATFRLEIRNATDRRYWLTSSAFGEPRTIVFSLSMQL